MPKQRFSAPRSAQENQDRYELIRRAKAGDQRAFETYAELNRGLLNYIVNKYAKYYPEHELADLFQEAMMGLMKGIERYQFDRVADDGRPEGYVFSWVRAYVGRYARSLDRNETFRTVEVFDEEGEKRDAAEAIVDESRAPDEVIGDNEVAAWLKEEMKSLTPRERKVARGRFLLKEQKTLGAIGEKLGVSRERVRQIESRIKSRLIERAEEDNVI